MSDFDKFFKDKLDEEQSFPRRNRNWKMVSKRLDAFDTGGQIGHSHLRYWQAFAVAASIAVALVAWKLVSVQKDNTRLREQVAMLQAEKPVASGSGHVPASTISIPENENRKTASGASANVAATTDAQGNELLGKTSQNTENQLFENKITPQKNTRNNNIAVNEPEPALIQNPAAKTPDSNAGLKNNPAKTATNTAASQQAPGQSADAPQQHVAALSQKADSAATISATLPGKDSVVQQNVAAAQQQQAVSPQTTIPANVDSTAKQENKKVLADAAPKDTTAAKAQQPPIQPLRSYDRLRAGAQVLAGIALPQENGVSALQGQGIQAEWRFWRRFSLLASADWLRFDLNTTKFIQRFHPHHPHPDPHGPGGGGPGGGGGGPFPNHELVQVESTQRQRQLSLGLRYTLPVRFWVQPSLRVAHSWVRIAPELLSLKFEENQPGPSNRDPRYLVEKTDTQRLDQVWRFGAGLERETARWVFSVGADYAKDFSKTDAMFDTMVFKAGLQYKIL